MRSNGPVSPSPQSPTRISARGPSPARRRWRARFPLRAPSDRRRGPSRGEIRSAAPAGSRPSRRRNRGCARPRPAARANSASAASTMVSVSARGSSTSGEIASVRLQKSRRPRMRDSGSPASRRAAKASTRAAASPSAASGARDQVDRAQARTRPQAASAASRSGGSRPSRAKSPGQRPARLGARRRRTERGVARQASTPWQCLYFLPDPQGQASLRPTLPQVLGSFGIALGDVDARRARRLADSRRGEAAGVDRLGDRRRTAPR